MKTQTFKFSVKKNKNEKEKASFIFEGDLSIKNCQEFLELIKNQANNYKDVLIDIKNVVNLDVTFIQLIIAVKKSFRTVSVNSELPQQIEEILNNSGLTELLRTKIIAN